MNITNQCDTCVHKDVCSYVDSYYRVLEAVKETDVYSTPSNSDGRVCITPIKNFEFIAEINVRCKYFRDENAPTLLHREKNKEGSLLR